MRAALLLSKGGNSILIKLNFTGRLFPLYSFYFLNDLVILLTGSVVCIQVLRSGSTLLANAYLKQYLDVTITMQWANSADDKLIPFFLIFPRK